ncbi:MAG TPA: hypothetical protein VMZ92_03220 [Planctomycetota bacterium]|nr:hypothetical protein [Planctomycetota bacterium]
MANFSTDEDLLKLEPELFRVHFHPSQLLTEGTDGVIRHSGSSVVFSSATADFINGGATSGHVLVLSKTSSNAIVYGEAYPVKSVEASTTALLEAKPGAMPTASSITFSMPTFGPQHEDAHFLLCDSLDIDDNDLNTENDEADLYNRRQLRQASCARVMEIFYMGQSAADDDFYWNKSTFWNGEYGRAMQRLKLKWDADGDSDPERTDIRASVDLVTDESGDAWPTADWTKAKDM